MAGTVRRVAFATPRALELRALQQAVDNIRQRFEALEAQVDALAASALTTTQAETIATIQKQIQALQAAGSTQQSSSAMDLSTLAVLVQALGANR